ncbi:MAG: hypothetical protein WBB69_05830 [Anaerolineales bacterium]
MIRYRSVLAVGIGVLLTLTPLLTIGDQVFGRLCVNYEYLLHIHDKTISHSLNTICGASSEVDEDLLWWQGYTLWKSGFIEEAISRWQLKPDSSVDRLISIYRLNNFSEKEKVSLLRNGLHISIVDDDLLGKISLFLFNELDIKIVYELFFSEWENTKDSPVLDASLAYVSSKYNLDGIPTEDLYIKAYNRNPENYHIILYGFLLYLEEGILEQDIIKEMAERGENIYTNDFAFIYHLSSVYKKLGDYSKAFDVNSKALLMNPSDSKTNLKQLELAYLTNTDFEAQWIFNALDITDDKTQYGLSYFQRLISILSILDEIDDAQYAFCQGLTSGFTPDELLVDNFKYLLLIFQNCDIDDK